MGVTPYYSIYSPFFPDPVLPTRNFPMKSPQVQQEAHHALLGGGGHLLLRLKSSWPESAGAVWEAVPVPRRSRMAPETEISSSELSPNFFFPSRRTAEAWERGLGGRVR